MPMNLVIQRRRKELGLTQEQLAQALNVTAPAVNKWEKSATCPDVSLLAPLARLLNIDMNELFCFREDLSDDEVQRFAEDILRAVRSDGLEAGFAMAAEKLREYPRCEALLYQCTSLLDGAALLYPEEGEKKDAFQAQLDAWYERCAECGDETIRKRAIYMLAGRYLRRDDAEGAQRMLDRLPDAVPLDKRMLQINILQKQGKLEDAAKLTAQALLMYLNEAQGFLWQLTGIEHACGNDEAATRIAEISRASVELFGLWDYSAVVAPLNLAMERRDAPESLRLLRRLLDASMAPWRPEDTTLFRRLATGQSKANMHNFLQTLIDNLEAAPESDFLRGTPGFAELIAEYKEQSERA